MEKIVRYLLDDLEDGEVEADGGTVEFGIDGWHGQIDLSKKNATKLRNFLEPFKERARAVGAPKKTASTTTGSSSGPRGGKASGKNKEQLAAIRDWARRNGWPDLSDKGRVPGNILEAFEASGGRNEPELSHASNSSTVFVQAK